MIATDAPPLAGLSWSARLARWRRPDLKRSLWQLASTATYFVLGWTLTYFSLRVSYWLTLALAVPTAFMMVRLFIVQHQFDRTYWERDGHWTYETAALEGSSYYKLPKLLQWLTGNIGIHHIHHLHAGIPNYFLPKVLDSFPELQRVRRLTLWQSFKCVPLALWDEQLRKLVPFRALRGSR